MEIVVEDDAAFRTSIEMIDLAGKQIARDKEEAKSAESKRAVRNSSKPIYSKKTPIGDFFGVRFRKYLEQLDERADQSNRETRAVR